VHPFKVFHCPLSPALPHCPPVPFTQFIAPYPLFLFSPYPIFPVISLPLISFCFFLLSPYPLLVNVNAPSAPRFKCSFLPSLLSLVPSDCPLLLPHDIFCYFLNSPLTLSICASLDRPSPQQFSCPIIPCKFSISPLSCNPYTICCSTFCCSLFPFNTPYPCIPLFPTSRNLIHLFTSIHHLEEKLHFPHKPTINYNHRIHFIYTMNP